MMKQPMEYEKIMKDLLAAHQRTYKRAYDVARQTKTAVVVDRDGELVELYPHLEEKGMNPDRRDHIGDRVWEKILPCVLAKTRGIGRKGGDIRLFVNGVFWILRRQVYWKSLPYKYGRWDVLYTRFRRWRHKGIWEMVGVALQDEPAYQWLMEHSSMLQKPSPNIDDIYRSFLKE